MMNYDTLKKWIGETFWDRSQVAGYAERTFFRRGNHQQTSAGEASGRLPFVLDANGEIDASFYDSDDVVLTSGDQAIAGVKDFTNGIKLNNGDTLTLFDQGTWTPVITGSVSNPTLTYTAQEGTYTRFNDTVLYRIRVVVNTISAAGSGDLRISIPFTSEFSDPGACRTAGVDIAAGAVDVDFETEVGQAFGTLVETNDNAAISRVQLSALGNGDVIRASGVFWI